VATIVGDLVVALRGDTRQFDAAMTRATTRMQAMSKQMAKTGKMLTTGLSLPLLAVGGMAAKMAVDFETSMSQIIGLVGVARDVVEAWKDEVKDLAPTVGKGANELGRALFFITSAGLRGSTAMEALEASAKGAAAGLGETATVADAATSAMNAYGHETINAEMATAVLVATVREGKAAASEIAPVIGAVIPVAAELGVSFDQVGASIAAMTRLGLNATMSATALQATLSTILKPTKQANDAMMEYGSSMADLRKLLREEGLIALLMHLKETFGENEEAMGKVFRNVRALRGVLSLVGASAEKTKGIFASLANTTENDLNKAFKAAQDTAGFKLKASFAELQTMMIDLGDVVLPKIVGAFSGLAKAARGVSGALDDTGPKTKEFAVNMTMWAIAIGPVVWGLSKIAWIAPVVVKEIIAINMATMGVINPVTKLSTAFTAVEAVLGAVVGWSGLFAVAIGAIALAIGVLIGNYLRPMFNEFEWMQTLFDLNAHKASDLTDAMMDANEVFDDGVYQLRKLKEQLHLTGKEWEFSSERTRTNAERIQMLTEKAILLGKKQRENIALAQEEMTLHERALDIKKRGQAQVAGMLDQANAAHDKRVQLLKEELGLYTAGDIAQGMEDLVEKNREMEKLGIDRNQRGKVFSDEMLMWLQLAEENKVAIPEGMKLMGDELKGVVNPQINKMLVYWKQFHHDARATGKVLDGIWMSTGDKVKAQLSGGFEKGIKDGVEKGGVHLSDFVQRIEDERVEIDVRFVVDYEDYQRQVRDIEAGRTPDTTG